MFKLKELFLLFLATMASSHAEDRRLRMAEKCVYKYYTPYWVRCMAAPAERRNPVRESGAMRKQCGGIDESAHDEPSRTQ
jgi:hypothetical protein